MCTCAAWLQKEVQNRVFASGEGKVSMIQLVNSGDQEESSPLEKKRSSLMFSGGQKRSKFQQGNESNRKAFSPATPMILFNF